VPSPRDSAFRRRDRWGLAALALYALLAFLIFGVGLLTGTGPRLAGTGSDPQVFVWAFAWWPHAILHGLNPVVTHVVWSPTGVNLAWATMMPGLALAFAPLTLATSAATSYDVAAVVMPALAAWTAFLLCRHVTGRLWPSLAGGYLFGFSSYMLGQQLGHLHMTTVFLVPLVALVVLQYVEDELDGRGLVLRLAPLLALQLLFSTELAFTITLALAFSLVLGLAVVPPARHRIVSSVGPIALAYVAAGALTLPFLYYLLGNANTEALHAGGEFDADLLNFVVPTKLTLAGIGWADGISRHFPGNLSERNAYLGIPALAIVALFAREMWRTAVGRFLLVSFAVAVVVSLGFFLSIDGHLHGQLPWAHIGYRPLFNNILPARIALYVSLVVAVMVAIWASRRGGIARWLLPLLAVLAILPRPFGHPFDESYAVPRFFTDVSYRSCLAPGERILPLPVSMGGVPDLWQVAAGFRFRMAGGYVTANPPASFLTPTEIAWVSLGARVPARDVGRLRTYIRDKGVTTVVVDAGQAHFWSAALDRIASPQRVGGVVLYRIRPSADACPAR
jgi:hypothetical protein